jgi:hypothetical protein
MNKLLLVYNNLSTKMNETSEVLTIYDGSSSQKYSDTFEKYSEISDINNINKKTDETYATKFIETYFYKFILRIQDSEIFSTRVAIYEIIVYALSHEEAISKGIKTLIENDKIFKNYGEEFKNLLYSLKINEQNIFDEHCKIDFLRNKIIFLTSEKIEVNKISILEEGHKEY